MHLPKRIITLVLAAVIALMPLPVAAHAGHDNGAHHEKQDGHQAPSQKLDETKRRICEKQQATIEKRMRHIVDMRTQQAEHITKIVERTRNFYQESGKEYVNYNALVASVDAKRQAVEVAINEARGKTELSCDDMPKTAIANFKLARNAMLEAVQAYRQSAKELIVGVKTAQEKR